MVNVVGGWCSDAACVNEGLTASCHDALDEQNSVVHATDAHQTSVNLKQQISLWRDSPPPRTLTCSQDPYRFFGPLFGVVSSTLDFRANMQTAAVVLLLVQRVFCDEVQTNECCLFISLQMSLL